MLWASDSSVDGVAKRSTELILIDEGVDNPQQLLVSLLSAKNHDAEFDVVTLNTDHDGISQITQFLTASANKYDAMHILSHGAAGEVNLGDAQINSANLSSYASQLKDWSASLTSNADVLFYGCELASNESGQRFIASISALTGADVAASSNITGAISKGGDWVLEAQAGVIDTHTFSPLSYTGILADTDGDSIDDAEDVDDDNDGILDNDERIGVRAKLADTATYSFSQDLLGGQSHYAGDVNVRTGSIYDPDLILDGDLNTGLRMHGGDIFEYSFGQVVKAGTSIKLIEGDSIDDEITQIYVSFGTMDPAADTNNLLGLGLGYVNTVTNGAATLVYSGRSDVDVEFVAPFDMTHIQFVGLGTHGGWAEIDFTDLVVLQDVDTDGDGVFDHRDLDSDNDGVSDLNEGGQQIQSMDTDLDGEIDDIDRVDPQTNNDANANGLSDAVELLTGGSITSGMGVTPVDTDLDGVSNSVDLDSDGDGIPDTVELRPTGGFVNNDADSDASGVSNNDADGDGVIDLFDSNDSNGEFGGTFFNPVDTDADGQEQASASFSGTTNAASVFIQVGNEDNALGIPNGEVATFTSPASMLILVLDRMVPAGTQIDITAKRTGADPGDTLSVSESDVGGAALANTQTYFLAAENTFEVLSYVTSAPTVYLRLSINQVDADIEIDGLEYSYTATEAIQIPDYRDSDSDNDTIIDRIEGGLLLLSLDENNDGIDDGVNASYADPDGDINTPPIDLRNQSGDTSEVAYREVNDTDADGIPDHEDLDDDNDGILDTDEGFGLLHVIEDFESPVSLTPVLGLDSLADASNFPAGTSSLSVNSGTAAYFFSDGAAINLQSNLALNTLLAPLSDGNSDTFDAYAGFHAEGALDAGSLLITLAPDHSIRPGVDYEFSFDAYQLQLDVPDLLIGFDGMFNDPGYIEIFGIRQGTSPDTSITGAQNRNNLIARADIDLIGTSMLIDNTSGWVKHSIEHIGGSNSYDRLLLIASSVDNLAGGVSAIGSEPFFAIDNVAMQARPNDTDADSYADYLDKDSDNDGISDLVESGADFAAVDTNKDGQYDDTTGESAQVDANGVPLAANSGVDPVDSDLDSVNDFLDQDSDNDAIPDAIEGHDADSDGSADTVPANSDTDADGLDNAFDVHDGGMAAPVQDTDADGLPDFLDTDSDADGIIDFLERSVDTDADGMPDYLDTDSDNDAILDVVEAHDADSNGIADASASGADSDADGLDNAFDENNGGTTAPMQDTDEDNIADYRDIDSDADGIRDAAETQMDSDADGVANYLDADSDADGIPDSVEGDVDTDGDGVPDYLDQDSDADGIADSLEQAGDTDSDGVPDYLDNDSDGDGIDDATEGNVDSDGDGVSDYLDNDSDADGINDATEGNVDSDGDGVADYLDNDSDADGIDDATEGNVDSDGDGVADYLDNDSDADGIPDSIEGIVDTDIDGVPDYLDTDSDNDGIPDTIEAGVTPNLPVDTDADGIPDFQDTDADNDGVVDAVEVGDNPGVPIDSDGDGTPDFQQQPEVVAVDSGGDKPNLEQQPEVVPVDSGGDKPDLEQQPEIVPVDTDGDGILDEVEGTEDTDGDNTPNHLDLDSDNDGISDAQEAGVFEQPIDTDGDSIPDYLDLDSDSDGLTDAYEAGAEDSNGDGRVDNFLDNNTDGLDDAIGLAPLVMPDADDDRKPDYIDLDSDNDGLPDVYESQGYTADTNGDGRVDSTGDANADGLGDDVKTNQLIDLDADGVPNNHDLDSDGDAMFDVIEAGGVDDDNNGYFDKWDDFDKDGVLDSVDVDVVGGFDLDDDEIADFADVDFVVGDDTDGDGIINRFDDDPNGSGFIKLRKDQVLSPEELPDANGNGIPDLIDPEIGAALPAEVIHTGVQGNGCSIVFARGNSMDSILLLLIASLYALLRKRCWFRLRR